MLGDKRFLRTIKLRNILSFGPDTPDFELESLNVLVGPNGAGKSNLIEAISLLQAAPVNLFEPVRAGGGIGEWLWKGSDPAPVAEVDVTVSYGQGKKPIRHRLKFGMVGQRAELADEAIVHERPGESYAYAFLGYQDGHPVLNTKTEEPGGGGRVRRTLRREDLALDQSVLFQ